MKKNRGPGGRKSGGGRVTPKGGSSSSGRATATLDRGHGLPHGIPARTSVTSRRIGARVERGLVSARRELPATIDRPPYADKADGMPPAFKGPNTRTADEIERMRVAGDLAAQLLLRVGNEVRPGVTTDHLDEVAHDECIRLGVYPSPLNYKGFPKAICTSVNEVICHGIPDSRVLKDGDIVNVDVTVYANGVHGDTDAMFLVGDVDKDSRRLCRVTRESMYRAIEAVRPGEPINVIGKAIQQHAHRNGIGVVDEFVGHGIGPAFHTSLQIPHYYVPAATTVIEEGMTFTIEPMLTLGSPRLHLWDDAWTAVTNDGSRSAQYEHTILVTADGAEILTATSDGRCAADVFAID
ncbi:MAG: type I methionyl aminopeptidase [Actinobacteria bacterium]|nr:type I methionyl aminopeptidase [Actinomycetota bacterium]